MSSQRAAVFSVHQLIQITSVVLVACPQADPLRTWMSSDIYPDHLNSPTSRASARQQWGEADTKRAVAHAPNLAVSHMLKDPYSWAIDEIRKRAEYVRILVYDHGDVADDKGLKSLADDLLQVVQEEKGRDGERPIFFICHSIGGLVVKLALTEASRNPIYRPILQNCYGVSFFATPHRGSKYLATHNYRPSIQRLLKLSKPLPSTLMNEMLPDQGTSLLLRIDENFKEHASEMRIWSFYEAQDSKLLIKSTTGPKEIHFTAPITAMRSALLGLRHEKVYGLQATHASCASFGRRNMETMRLFLEDFGTAARKANELNKQVAGRASLNLEQHNEIVEVHGFYGSISAENLDTDSSTRIFSTKSTLSNFCDLGPEQLLQKRLHIAARPDIPRVKPNKAPWSLNRSTALPEDRAGDRKRTGKSTKGSHERRSSRTSFSHSIIKPQSTTDLPGAIMTVSCPGRD